MEPLHIHDKKESVPLVTPLLALATQGGTVEVWSSEWLGVVFGPVLRLTVCLGPRFAVASGNSALACFGVSLPPRDLRVPPWLPALLAGAGDQVLADAGLAVTFGQTLGAPLVEAFPVGIECRNGQISVQAGVVLVTAEVAAVHADPALAAPGEGSFRQALRPFLELLPGAATTAAGEHRQGS